MFKVQLNRTEDLVSEWRKGGCCIRSPLLTKLLEFVLHHEDITQLEQKKIQSLVCMWSKPTTSFSNVGIILLKIWTFFWAPFPTHTFTIRLTVHPTFPFKTVEQYTNNRIDQNYSTAYKIASLAYYTPSKRDFKKPSKEHRKLKDKIMEIYAK